MPRSCWTPACCLALLSLAAPAQTTKQWTVDRFDQMQRGTADGVAIRNDGRLEAGPALKPLATLAAPYIWSVATDPIGNAYVATGGTTGGSAGVLRITPDGAQTHLFQGKELAAQAVRVAADGTVFAATSPDGKLFRLGSTPGAERVLFDPATTAEKPKYLWDLALAPDGTAYLATGAPAAVYRIPPTGTPELLFSTTDQHIRSLLLAPDGTLWAGSDGAGVIYRLNTRDRAAKPFAAYAAARREITALALDPAGNLFAAAVGAKSPTTLPPLPVTGAVGISITISQPGSTTAAGANGVVPDGSEIDRLDARDGTPARLLTLPNDVVYALGIRNGALIAATGNRGRIFRIDPAVPGRLTELAHLEAGVATALAPTRDGLLVGSGNGARLARLLDTPAPNATYTSEVFDAGQFSRWGRLSTEADAPGFALAIRTGNVPNPLDAWSPWTPVAADGSAPGLPAGRFAQWRATLLPGGLLDTVTLNFLPRNVAPIVDDLVVAPGARVQSTPAATQPATVQLLFPNAAAPAQAIAFLQQDSGTTPLSAQKDRNAVTIRWSAHDDNNDDLLFAVSYRGVGEANWRPLKDNLSDRFLSFDASLLPDGRYEARVTASDAPTHTDADTLTGERISAAFLIDTTPPVPGPLHAQLQSGKVHWTLEATDATSPIAHAEASLDGGPWQFVDPVGALSDARTEHYDSILPLPPTPPGTANPTQHVLAVRVFDRADNMVSTKTVVASNPAQ